MSVIDDIRKLLQDLISPDLKAIKVEVVALKQEMDLKFKHLEEKMDLKFDLSSATAAANHAAIMHALDLDRRMERLESDRENDKRLDRPS